MCLGVPAKIITITGNTAKVIIGETQITVGIELVPDAVVGNYVLVHAGFAVQLIDEKEALVTWNLIKELAEHEHRQ